MSLEFETVGSGLVRGLLDGGGCILKETLGIRQLGAEAGQDLLNRWETAVCDHQLLFQLTDTTKYLKHNQKHKQDYQSFQFRDFYFDSFKYANYVPFKQMSVSDVYLPRLI